MRTALFVTVLFAVATQISCDHGLACPPGTVLRTLKNDDGSYARQCQRKRGQQQGDSAFYDARGQVTSTGEFRDGVRHGVWRHFDADRKLTKVETFDRGFLLGEQTFHGPSRPARRRLWVQGPNRRPVPAGTWETWSASGVLLLLQNYAEGKRHGRWEVRREGGQLAWAGNYEAGHKRGEWAWWRADGEVEAKHVFDGGPEDLRFVRDCTQTDDCTQLGLCDSYLGDCVRVSAASCEAGCPQMGTCTPTVDGCRAQTDADCARSRVCEQMQRCTARGGQCVRPDDFCKDRVGCTENGECTLVGDSTCVVGSDEDCAGAAVCQTRGWCTNVDGACFSSCKESAACKSSGQCTLRDDGRCVADSVRDCRASTGCRSYGFCSLQDGSCRVRSSADCRRSTDCKEHGRCRAYQGNCYSPNDWKCNCTPSGIDYPERAEDDRKCREAGGGWGPMCGPPPP